MFEFIGSSLLDWCLIGEPLQLEGGRRHDALLLFRFLDLNLRLSDLRLTGFLK